MSIIGIDIRLIGKKRTGDETVFFNLVKNLAVIDNQNQYKLFTDMTDATVLQNTAASLEIENKKNFEIISLPTKNKFTWNFWTLPRYLRSHSNVEIYLTQYILPWFVPSRVKLITIIHDISFKVFPQFIRKSDLFFLNRLIPVSLKRADKILGVSRFTRDEIIKHYKIAPEKVDWFYNAVSEDFLAQDISEKKIKNVKKKYSLPENYILYIGTLQPRKNLPTLVGAVSAALAGRHEPPLQERNIKLVIAGGKGHNYDIRIDEAIEKYGLTENVIMSGFIDEEDKAAVIAGAEMFCFPSLYEGFGIPILEAMAVGTPVIASNIAPHREIAGKAALLFEPRDAVELAQKVSEILNDNELREILVHAGRTQSNKFSWKKTTEKMLRIFNGIAIDKEFS